MRKVLHVYKSRNAMRSFIDNAEWPEAVSLTIKKPLLSYEYEMNGVQVTGICSILPENLRGREFDAIKFIDHHPSHDMKEEAISRVLRARNMDGQVYAFDMLIFCQKHSKLMGMMGIRIKT